MPPGTRAHSRTIGLQKKINEDGSIKFKARWVIRGNMLSDTYFKQDRNTYALVVSQTTSRILFAAAAHYGWRILQADVFRHS
jgi:hypothetical protein